MAPPHNNLKRARPGGHEFVRLLETPLELCERLPAMNHTCRIYQKLYGIAEGKNGSEAPSDEEEKGKEPGQSSSEATQTANEDTNALLKALRRCVLCEEAWSAVDHPTRLQSTSRALLDEMNMMRTNLEHWMDAFARDPKVQLQSAVKDREHDAYLNGIALLQSVSTLYQNAFTAIRPCMANLETFNERKDAMNELGGIKPKLLVPCIDPEAYQVLESEVEEALVSHRHVPVQSNLRKRSILRSVEEARQLLALQDAKDQNEVNASHPREFDGLARCTQRAQIPGTEHEQRPGLVKIIDQAQQYAVAGNMKARGAQSKPEARLNRRYSIEALFGTAEDRILSYLRKRCMAFLQNELLIDMYSLCAILLTTGLGLAEALRQSDIMADFIAHGHVLASHFIGASLPLMEKTLGFEADLVHFNMMNLSLRGLSHEQGANRSMHRQIRKLRIIDKILEGLDVHVFPWTIPIHYAAVRCITRSHLDPNILLTAGDDCAMRIWDIRTGACMGFFAGHTSIVSWCAFSPDDKLIVSASFDMSLKVWDSRTGRCTCTLIGHSDSILDGDLSANGKLILSASMDGTVRLWSTETGACYRVYRGHREGTWVKVVRFLPEDAGFVSGGLDGRVALWRIRSADHAEGSPLKRRDRASTRRAGSSRSVSAAKNSSPLMAPYAPKFDDLEERAERQVCEEQELALRPMHVFTDLHSDVIVSMEVLVRRQRSALLVTASKDGSQQIVDLSTFELLKSIMSATSSTWAITVAISNDGRFFALAYFDNTVHIHAMHNYALLRRIHVQNRGITRLLFAPDASYIVIGTSTGKLQVIAL